MIEGASGNTSGRRRDGSGSDGGSDGSGTSGSGTSGSGTSGSGTSGTSGTSSPSGSPSNVKENVGMLSPLLQQDFWKRKWAQYSYVILKRI